MFEGRIGRLEFLGFQVVAFILIIVAVFVGSFFAAIGGGGGAFVGLLIILGGIIWGALTSIKAYVRRFHDFDQRGAWVLLSFVPFLGTLVFLFCLIRAGDEGVNRFDYDGVRLSPGLPPYASRAFGNQGLCNGSGSNRYSSPTRDHGVCNDCGAEIAMSNGRLLTHRATMAAG